MSQINTRARNQGGNLLMLTSDATSAGRRFGLDGASIRFTLACLHRAVINQAKQQCRANTGCGEQRGACIVVSDQNGESILSKRVEGCEEEDWGEIIICDLDYIYRKSYVDLAYLP